MAAPCQLCAFLCGAGWYADSSRMVYRGACRHMQHVAMPLLMHYILGLLTSQPGCMGTSSSLQAYIQKLCTAAEMHLQAQHGRGGTGHAPHSPHTQGTTCLHGHVKVAPCLQ